MHGDTGIPLEIIEFPGHINITTIEHPDNHRFGSTVGIFVPDEKDSWMIMSRFQKTSDNIFRLKPTCEGELTLNGTIIPVGANVTIEEQCKIFVHYVNDEDNWR